MIIVEANNDIHKRWRDKDGVRQEEVSTTYRPYFFIERGDEMPQVIESNTRFGVNRIRPNYTFGEWESLSGKPLVTTFLGPVPVTFIIPDLRAAPSCVPPIIVLLGSRVRPCMSTTLFMSLNLDIASCLILIRSSPLGSMPLTF